MIFVLVSLFCHLCLLGLFIVNGDDYLILEIFDTLRTTKGQLTQKQMSTSFNKCLKQDLQQVEEGDYIKNFVIQRQTEGLIATVVWQPRLYATVELSLAALALTASGDFVETGLFTGGTASLMILVLQQFDKCDRKFWGYDSFEGLPPPAPEDESKFGVIGKSGDYSFGYERVVANLKNWKVWDDDKVILTKGYFNDTLPKTAVSEIAFLRLDGDLFESTWDALVNLYSKVVPGGLIYVDDYGSFPGCRRAVDSFRSEHHIYEPLHYVRNTPNTAAINFEAVWWQKRLHKK